MAKASEAKGEKAAGKTKVEAQTGKKADGIHKLVQPSEALAAIVGEAPLARGEVVSRLWDYIKQHKLQDPNDGRKINADDKLQPVFGKASMTMFEMNKAISQHLS